MSKVRDISNLSNVIRTDASGNVSFVSGSTTLATLNTSGQLSGSSPVLSSSYASTSSYATNFNVSGTITATTLVVQTITSSVSTITGSTQFGSSSINTHQFTGSLSVTGSSTFNGALTAGGPLTIQAGTGLTKHYFTSAGSGDALNQLYDNTGSIKIQLYTNGNSYFNGGSLGIGTPSPSSILHIKGILNIERSNTSSVSTLSNEGGNFYINAASGFNTIFQIGSTEFMRISGSGQIGIGTISPTGSLHLKGSNSIVGSFGSQILLLESSTDNYSGIVFSGTGGYNAAIRTEGGNIMTFWTVAAGNSWGERMRISGSGTVGINTTSPTSNAGLTVKRPNTTGWIIDALNSSNTRVGGFYVTGGGNGQLYLYNNSGVENIVLDSAGSSYLLGGNVGIGTSLPLATLSTIGGAVQFMGDYRNHQTIIKSSGTSGTLNGVLTITIPQMSDASTDGYGGYSCEVYVAGYAGNYCHAWFSGYINGGLTSSEATILRSNGGWSISQASYGANNQGFQFTIDYPNGIIHPTARIIFNKGGSTNSAAYPANSITATWS